MPKVLVVDDEALLAEILAAALEAAGHETATATRIDDALAILMRGGTDVLLTDLYVGERTGLELIEALRNLAAPPTALLMSGHAGTREVEIALRLGVVRVLGKPISMEALLGAIEVAGECKSGFHGSIHGISIVDVLQLFHFARRSLCVRLRCPMPASIDLIDGEVVHAERGDLVGEAAFVAILGATTGAIATDPPRRDVTRSISCAFSSLLLDALRVSDESARRSARPQSQTRGLGEESGGSLSLLPFMSIAPTAS